MEDAADLSKMKVADLKKELKARGLPLSGNKNELVERLQEALATGDGTLPLGTTEGEEEDFDEEEILAGEVDMDADLGKLTPQEEEAALQGTIRESALLEPEKKKISLKRSEPTLPAQENGQEVSDSNDKENTETTPPPPPKKIVKINAPPSDAPVTSNLEARAQRFGISSSEASRKQARAERFGMGNARRPAKLSSETGDIDVGKLRARAERFGEVTSKILTQAASNEQIKKRQERFGLVPTTSSSSSSSTASSTTTTTTTATTTTTSSSETKTATDTPDAKAARAARFGLSGATTESGTATTAAASPATTTATAEATPEEEDMKKKRAERFASK